MIEMRFAGDWRCNPDAHVCSVATAIIGSAVIGGAATAYGASKAADAQQASAQNATDAQLQMFNTSRAELQPFIDAGTSAIPGLQQWNDQTNAGSPLSSLLKLTTPGADQTATLEQTPGFQFANTYGQKAVKNALAARGLAGPGGALGRGLADYSEGLAQNTWQSVVNNLLNTYTAGAGAKQNMVNTGAGAAGTLTGAATQTGGQIGSNIIGAGNAQAASNIATGNAISGVGNSIGSAALLSKLLGSNGGSSIYGTNAGTYGGTGGFF